MFTRWSEFIVVTFKTRNCFFQVLFAAQRETSEVLEIIISKSINQCTELSIVCVKSKFYSSFIDSFGYVNC